jgi:lipopolysaccharide transport system permease protein
MMAFLASPVRLQAHLVAREFRLRYRRSVLGWLWAFVQPLARLAILTFVFTQVIPLGIDNYPVFLFSGIISWTWFSNGVMSATASPLALRYLLFQPIRRFIVPTVSVASDSIDFVLALPILLGFAVIAGGRLGWSLLFLPVVMTVQFALVVGLGAMLATAHVWVRDVQKIVEVALTLGFYVTPVLYQPGQVPERFQWIAELNPMAHLISAYRVVIIEGGLPNLREFAVVAFFCGAIATLGYFVYGRFSTKFVDEL